MGMSKRVGIDDDDDDVYEGKRTTRPEFLNREPEVYEPKRTNFVDDEVDESKREYRKGFGPEIDWEGKGEIHFRRDDDINTTEKTDRKSHYQFEKDEDKKMDDEDEETFEMRMNEIDRRREKRREHKKQQLRE